ncbi:hypothetical protein RvY_13189 [Ramazzottius varieornatus]|uniref:Uncharacterized protein n=1 Tax=Ramazzottius varieornatus TaxID=947166 RepID=A0A1D1VNX5_RAMVA|nr:hypothetical protein RvY_13189 [Ramazzottius varieornatus]
MKAAKSSIIGPEGISRSLEAIPKLFIKLVRFVEFVPVLPRSRTTSLTVETERPYGTWSGVSEGPKGR